MQRGLGDAKLLRRGETGPPASPEPLPPWPACGAWRRWSSSVWRRHLLMQFVRARNELIERDVTAGPQRLFAMAVAEQRQIIGRKGGQYLRAVSGLMAPDNSVYRVNGLLAERRRHSLDLWRQLFRLADEHEDIICGPGYPQDYRARLLHESLGRARVRRSVALMQKAVEHSSPRSGSRHRSRNTLGRLCTGASTTSLPTVVLAASGAAAAAAVDSAGDARCISAGLRQEPLPGYHPVLEFLAERVVLRGQMVVPEEWADWWRFFTSSLVASTVFVIQILVPSLTVYVAWYSDTNYFAGSSSYLGLKLLEDAPACATTEDDQLATVVGSLLIVLLIFVVRLHSDDEGANADKCSVLPLHASWLLAGNVAKAYCAIAVCLAAPLLLWQELAVSHVIFDIIGLLVIFRLDVLVSTAGLHGVTDFQRDIFWTHLLLSQCPLRLADIINPHAPHLEELWHIEVDSEERLLDAPSLLASAQPSASTSRGSIPIAMKPPQTVLCRTRLMESLVKTAKQTGIAVQPGQYSDTDSVDSRTPQDEEQMVLLAQADTHSDGAGPTELPDPRCFWIRRCWVGVGVCLLVMQLVLPFAYVLLDETPCRIEKLATVSAAVNVGVSAEPRGASSTAAATAALATVDSAKNAAGAVRLLLTGSSASAPFAAADSGARDIAAAAGGVSAFANNAAERDHHAVISDRPSQRAWQH
eukprot:TRINITY_DN8211_c0_g1_i1.p1 TRINITY_DN8211_c0_g1~~TRINITY_DN8211_c0_g1_i1.p1  ORF type:complete len:698 (-),score=109.36 TRINITY_DN8211_c0_g1_i1:40-2133(-)